MPVLKLDDLDLHYETHGKGEKLVVLVMGTGAKGNVWNLHQVPALVAAGYEVVTYDSRGISLLPGQTDTYCPSIIIDDLVSDLASLIEHLGGYAHVVGTSLGARVAQELALSHPKLVDRVVSMAAHARIDPVQHLLTLGEQALFDQSIKMPPAYQAAIEAVFNLSPSSLRDDFKRRDWLDILEMTAGPVSSGERAQLEVTTSLNDRSDAYRGINQPVLVVAFADDVTIPTYLSCEVADVIPQARYVEIPDAGHFGYLEQPEAVNRLILEFLKMPLGQVTAKGS